MRRKVQEESKKLWRLTQLLYWRLSRSVQCLTAYIVTF